MMNIIKKYSRVIIGIVIGALGGFLYWNYVGCYSGQCMITSVWYNSVIYGSIMGGLLGSSFTGNAKKSEPEDIAQK